MELFDHERVKGSSRTSGKSESEMRDDRRKKYSWIHARRQDMDLGTKRDVMW
jgi:hypothetical protein